MKTFIPDSQDMKAWNQKANFFFFFFASKSKVEPYNKSLILIISAIKDNAISYQSRGNMFRKKIFSCLLFYDFFFI